MNKSPITRLELPAESQNESFARIFAASYSARLDPTLEELADIKTVISEAVTNAVVHAYPGRKGVIHILARVVDGDTLEFTVKDKGTGIENVEKAMEAFSNKVKSGTLDEPVDGLVITYNDIVRLFFGG